MCVLKYSKMRDLPTKFNLLLLIYILMNTVKNYSTINLWLNEIDALEVVILLMTYLIKYVFQKKTNLNIHVFNMVTGKHESKVLAKDISCK